MRFELVFLVALAAAHVHVQPTPEMTKLTGELADLSKQLNAIGKEFQTSWSDQGSIKKLTDQMETITNKMEPLEKQYHHLKKEAKKEEKKEAKAEKAAAKKAAADAAAAKAAAPVATDAPVTVASSSAAPASTDAPAKSAQVALTPEKILMLLAAVADGTPVAPAATKSPIEQLQDEIKSLKNKLNGYGKDFSHPENYSSSENIQKLVGKIEDTQVKMSQDYEKLSKLKKAAKKAAEAAAAKEAAEEEAAAQKAAAKAKEEAAKAAETTAAPKETSKAAEAAPTTSAAPAYSKEPLMLVATDSEASFGLWYFLAGSFCLASAAYGFHRMSSKWGYQEIKPLLRRGEYYNSV